MKEIKEEFYFAFSISKNKEERNINSELFPKVSCKSLLLASQNSNFDLKLHDKAKGNYQNKQLSSEDFNLS